MRGPFSKSVGFFNLLTQGANAFLRNGNKTFIIPQLEKNKTF